MKKHLIVLPLITLSLLVNAQEKAKKGIAFHESTWAEALAKAKKENKLIFLDAYATWCGPCKWLAKTVFPQSKVGDFFNKNFISMKIDMEKGEGTEIAKTYKIEAYPTLLYINGDGELVHRTCGAAEADVLIAQGKDALDPSKNLAGQRKQFESKPDAATAYSFLSSLEAACMSYDKELRTYLNTVPEKELTSQQNWNIIHRFLGDASVKEFDYLLNNKAEFEKLSTVDSVERKILNTYRMSMHNSLQRGDSAGYEFFKHGLIKTKHPEAQKMAFEADLDYYESKGDKEKYAKTAEVYIPVYGKDNADALNSIAWYYYEHIDNKDQLKKALDWSKRSVELEDSYANNDTYAALHYKLGNKQEAMKAAQKAIDIAKKNNEDAQGTEELLKKIKEMK